MNEANDQRTTENIVTTQVQPVVSRRTAFQVQEAGRDGVIATTILPAERIMELMIELNSRAFIAHVDGERLADGHWRLTINFQPASQWLSVVEADATP